MGELIAICEDNKFKGRTTRYRYYSLYVLDDVDKTRYPIFEDGVIVKHDYRIKTGKSEAESPAKCAVVVGYENNHVYIIGGGDSERNPRRDVLVLSGLKSKNIKGPSLISGKYNPIAVSSKTHLYVFSRMIHDIGFEPGYSCLEQLPRCEVLSWDSGSVWSAFEIPSLSSLPPPPGNPDKYMYQIDAYLCGDFQGFNGVFLSIKHVCSYFVSVDHGWTFSPKELPFMFEAKQMYSDVYAATSRSSSYAGFIGLYRFNEDQGNFHFDQLAMFPIFGKSIVGQSFPDPCIHNWMFQPLSENTICLIHSCVPSQMLFDFSQTTTESPFILARVVKLNWKGESGVSDDAATTSARKRKKKTHEPHLELLRFTKYLDIPPPQRWCFLPIEPLLLGSTLHQSF